MLIIRLIRTGKKNASSFRIVLTEKKNAAKSGRFLEVLGSYNPRLREKKITLKKERIEYWISQGAQVSDTVHNLLVSQSVIKGPKIARKIKSKKGAIAPEGEQPVEEKKEAVESSEEGKKEEEKPAEEKKEEASEEKEKE